MGFGSALALLWSAIASGAPDIDAPLRTAAVANGDAAVVVGLEDYAFLPDVPYAARDADAVYSFLRYTRGVPGTQIHQLNSANREQILHAVSEAASQVAANGRLWIYFAGHGAASSVDRRRLLLGDDTKADELVFETRAVSVDEVVQLAERSAAASVLVMLDACYGGVGRDGGQLLPGKRFSVPAYAVPVTPKVSVWSAASANELSGPFEPSRHGAFTFVAVGAMRGWADGELTGSADQVVTLEEAQAYVRRSLRDLGNHSQTPTEEEREDPLGWELASGGALESDALPGAQWVVPSEGTLGGHGLVGAPPAGGGPGCPWSTIEDVHATMGTVIVNSVSYDVRGREDREVFGDILGQCGEGDARWAFERWRSQRRAVNRSLLYYPAAPFIAASAGSRKHRLVKELEE